MTALIDTIEGSLFGTSMPIVPLPGIGAMIRMPKAESERAMLCLKVLYLRHHCSQEAVIIS